MAFALRSLPILIIAGAAPTRTFTPCARTTTTSFGVSASSVSLKLEQLDSVSAPSAEVDKMPPFESTTPQVSVS